jgi:5-formyltetrahydrofolate cyclo-ligase
VKGVLRDTFRERRVKISKEYGKEDSKLIMKRLFALPEYKDAKTVMFYVSFKDEVNTHSMIKAALKGKRVAVPKIRNGKMLPSLIKKFDELSPKNYGILEPTKYRVVKNIDLIIVPGIAFDLKGHRLGSGLGYYDRFLQDKKTLCVGITYNRCLIKHIPATQHDISVGMVVTERRTVDCRKR